MISVLSNLLRGMFMAHNVVYLGDVVCELEKDVYSAAIDEIIYRCPLYPVD